MGLTILFAEQNMHFATEISDRAYVIEKGRIRFQGTMRSWPPTRKSREVSDDLVSGSVRR